MWAPRRASLGCLRSSHVLSLPRATHSLAGVSGGGGKEGKGMCSAGPRYTAGRPVLVIPQGGQEAGFKSTIPWLWLLGNYLSLHASVSPSETWGLVSTSQSRGKLPLLTRLEP